MNVGRSGCVMLSADLETRSGKEFLFAVVHCWLFYATTFMKISFQGFVY
jgi:hypothetical protein